VRVVNSTPYRERQLFVIHIRPRANTAVTILIDDRETENCGRNDRHKEGILKLKFIWLSSTS
jgi:hypothetical protein